MPKRKVMDSIGDTLQYPEGLKWTKQRKKVYRVLAEAKEPLGAVQIYNLVEQATEGEEYAVSTIYRILAAFEKQGLVEKSAWLDGKMAAYSLNRGEHIHYAVCLECHRRIPLQGCPLAHISFDRGTDDFMITSHKLELYGYCKKCRETASGFSMDIG